MKLTDEENFEISLGGAIGELDNYPMVENCKDLKTIGVTQDATGVEVTIELENGKKLFIKAKDSVAAQCLGKIIIIIQREYIGKELKNLIDREFCLAEKLS